MNYSAIKSQLEAHETVVQSMFNSTMPNIKKGINMFSGTGNVHDSPIKKK